MWRVCLAVTAAVLLLAPRATAGPTVTTPTVEAGDSQPEAAKARIADALDRARHDDTGGVLGIMAPLVASPAYGSLETSQQAFGLYLLAWAAYGQKDDATAHGAAVRSVTLDSDNQQAWLLRLGSAERLKDSDDAEASLAAIARRWPASLATMPDGAIFAIVAQAHGPGRKEMLLAMHDAHWRPKHNGSDASQLWFLLVTDLIADGDLAQAQLVARDITGFSQLIAMHADRRFDAIVAADPARFDVAAAHERALAQARAHAAASPTSLDAVNTLARALLERNAAEEALAVLQSALAKTRSGPAGKAYFTDEAANLNFTLDYQSRALRDLGRVDEAIKVQHLATAQSEDGAANVSQILNLADVLDDLGRPRDALKALEGFDRDHTSAYGATVLHEDLACAYAQLGADGRAGLAASLDYLKAHAQDSPANLQNALLCAGDADGYARAVIAGLDDPETRARTLVELQNFLPSPGGQSAWHTSLDAFARTVQQRADVQAAIAKYGRIGSYPVRLNF